MFTENAELNTVLEEAQHQLRTNTKKSLHPIYRASIYRVFSQGEETNVHLKRTALDYLSSQKVLSIWDNLASSEHKCLSPVTILTIAHKVLKADILQEQGREIAESYVQELERIDNYLFSKHILPPDFDPNFHFPYDLELMRPSFAIRTAIGTLFTACESLDFDFVDVIGEASSNSDLDPWSTDPPLWAVSSYAGAEWGRYSDANKRYEFWNWWIQEAVPQAWNLAPSIMGI